MVETAAEASRKFVLDRPNVPSAVTAERKEIVESLIDEVGKTIEDVKQLIDCLNPIQDIHSMNEIYANFTVIRDITVKIVGAVQLAAEKLGGISADERLEVAVAWLDSLIKLPWYMEAFDGTVIRMAIKWAVSTLNAKFGHQWDLDTIMKLLRGELDLNF